MERKSLAITQVGEITSGDRRDGRGKWQSLSFKAKDGEKELTYSTFRQSLFEAIKVGQTINADVEIQTYEKDGESRTNRKIAQIYIDGQPIGGKGQQGYRGKSPEELELSAKSYALSYAKDLVVAQVIPLAEITKQADVFYQWLKSVSPQVMAKQQPKAEPKDEITFDEPPKPEVKIQNVTEFKGLLSKHKIGTREAYEILSIGSFMELVDLDAAWKQIKEAKQIA